MKFKTIAKKAKFDRRVPPKNFSSKEESKSLEKTPKKSKVTDKGLAPNKGIRSTSKPSSKGSKPPKFINEKAETAYKIVFSKRNVLGERDVTLNDLNDPEFEFIAHIFTDRGWEKITEGAPAPYIEIVREFYANALLSVDNNCITSVVRRVDMIITPDVIKEFYELSSVENLDFPYKGMGTPSKAQMKDLFAGPSALAWPLKIYRLSMKSMLPEYRFLAKVVLTNLWPISRHPELTVEKTQFGLRRADDGIWYLKDYWDDIVDMIAEMQVKFKHTFREGNFGENFLARMVAGNCSREW